MLMIEYVFYRASLKITFQLLRIVIVIDDEHN